MKKRILVLGCLIFSQFNLMTANALETNLWHNGQDFKVERTPYLEGRVEKGGCEQYSITILSGSDLEALVQPSCILEGPGISIAKYIDVKPWPGRSEERFALKLHGDTFFHVINGVSPSSVQFQPLSSGYVLVHNLNHSYDHSYADYELIKDFRLAFTFDILAGRYNYLPINNSQLFNYALSTEGQYDQSLVVDKAVSKNGKYLMAYAGYKYIIVANLENGFERVIAREPGSNYGGYNNPYAGTISNDGKYVFVANSDKMYHVDEECGEQLTHELHSRDYILDKPCTYTSMAALLRDKIPYSYLGVYYELNEDNTSMSYVTYHLLSAPSSRENITIKTEMADQQKNKIEYLALGDSYSSGEGDIYRDGISHYFPLTDYPGGCHVSARSYPFLLAQMLQLRPDSVKSVACSGAHTVPDVNSEPGSYIGQNRRLEGMTDTEKTTVKRSALSNFTPGIVPQVEFVKKYKPRILSITTGGNDIGFGAILQECAGLIPDRVGIDMSTCLFALPNSRQTTNLKDAIRYQADYIGMLVRKINEVSPDTKVYLLGYPKFIAEHVSSCKLDAGFLNDHEIKAINNYVTVLNNTIKNVAIANRVNYVDLENALVGGRLCEGGMYITSMNDLPGYVFGHYSGDRSQAFHPNHFAHQKIANVMYASIVK